MTRKCRGGVHSSVNRPQYSLSMSSDRVHDVVIYGATGFVGRLTAAYLAKQPAGPRIALAGRSGSKLEELRADLGSAAAEWPLIVADAADAARIAALAAGARVVATTVGPYAKYGKPLVEACAKAGTHYADLTGEIRFVRESIDEFDAIAKETGARIVISCGFDAIPSDLGVLVLHDGVRRDHAGDLEDTRLVLTAFRGGVSGGTLASLKGQVDEMKSDKALRRLVADPYALSPERDKEPELGAERDARAIIRDPDTGHWLGPFVMAPYNTRIVRRSNALQGWAYGRHFRYSEMMGFPSGPLGLATAAGMTVGLAAVAGGLMLRPTRTLLDRVLPSPGEGPSEKVQRNGFFTIEIRTCTSSGARYLATVTGKGDPGYSGTAVMLAESALALAFDGDALPPIAGVVTPAAGIGAPLVDRLRKHGFTFDVTSVPAR
jgi:short subunit dehydrogenase-like uncharacterized protein